MTESYWIMIDIDGSDAFIHKEDHPFFEHIASLKTDIQIEKREDEEYYIVYNENGKSQETVVTFSMTEGNDLGMICESLSEGESIKALFRSGEIPAGKDDLFMEDGKETGEICPVCGDNILEIDATLYDRTYERAAGGVVRYCADDLVCGHIDTKMVTWKPKMTFIEMKYELAETGFVLQEANQFALAQAKKIDPVAIDPDFDCGTCGNEHGQIKGIAFPTTKSQYNYYVILQCLECGQNHIKWSIK